MAKMKLSSPWAEYARKLAVMFGEDSEVHVVYDEERNVVKLYVDDIAKATALGFLIPEHKTFGDVTLTINIYVDGTLVEPHGCQNADVYSSSKPKAIADLAFAGNKALSYILTICGVFTNDITYVVFAHKVVQYFNDSLSDVNGMRSTIYEEIAREIFADIPGLFYCTDVPGPEYDVNRKGLNLGAPLGEWP